MEQIKEVQIRDPSCDDRFIWPSEKKGKYTVKSGYHWILSREVPIQHRRSSLLASINKQVWKSIWKLEIPLKIRIFMWQILHRALATRMDLFKRHVDVSPTCPICNEEEESVEHLFLLCPWVQLVWFGGQLNYKVIHKINCGHTAFMEANKRSNRAAVGSGTSPGNQANLIRDPQTISVWSPPKLSWYKVNVDASWISTTKKGYVATVIRDSNGRFIAARKQSILAKGVQEAEAKAILEGCKLANHLELGKVIIESDSKEVVSSLCNSIYQGRWEAVSMLWKAM